MKHVFLILVLTLSLNACAHRAELAAPKCDNQSESCLDAWYQYGDVTGDYGVIDVAE
jgi:hypothetical protein